MGILLIDKPKGLTSHDVVDLLRARLGIRRVGHAGTLDPLATGLLVVAVGPATRFLQYLSLEPKVYEVEATFGATSTTFDAEGEIEPLGRPPEDLKARIESEIPSFLGVIQQVPPAFSAVKVKGVPLYKRARRGEAVRPSARTVHVAEIETLRAEGPSASLRIVCSGGTYVRSLVNDLGAKVGCGAYVSALRRTRAGSFTVEEAVLPEGAKAENLLPLAEALRPMPHFVLSDENRAAALVGRPFSFDAPDSANKVALSDSANRFVGVARVDCGWAHPECILPQEVHS